MEKLPISFARQGLHLICGTLLCLTPSACGVSLLPVSRNRVESPWQSFAQAKDAFDKVIPYQTTKDDLHALSLDPFQNTNIEILTYLDLTKLFMPNSSFRKEDLDQRMQNCLNALDKCYGYNLTLSNMESKRYGNVVLDLFNFKRKSQKKGWIFKALIVLQDDVVVYKIWGGKPQVDEYVYNKNPLGPLQESEGTIKSIAVETAF